MTDKPLDRDVLRSLRSLMDKASEDADGNALPLKELAALAGIPAETGVTIDFEASEELGHPLVVLRGNAFPDVLKELSPREQEVSRLVADGTKTSRIASISLSAQ